MSTLDGKKPDIGAVYNKYSDTLYRVALTRLANEADAQDAVSDVFIKYIDTLPHFRDSDHEQAWFLRATVNRCHDILRQRKVRESLPIEDALGVAVTDRYGVSEVLDILSVLDEKYKDTVILHCLEGYSLKKTAKILGISLSAAKMRLKRARQTLTESRQEDTDVQ